MRELKFRCFYRGEMYPVEELHFSPDGSFSVGSIKMDLDGLGLRSVSPDSEHIEGIMQYVGLKDKTGKDIYEGDFICWPHLNMYDVYEVYFNENELIYVGRHVDKQIETEAYIDGTCAIIGNIHQLNTY